MKIRNGFVSNSSSSSFICDVCGAEASGWDMSMDEAGTVQCVNGHMFCEDHLDDMTEDDKNAIKQELIDRYLEYLRKNNPDATEDDVPSYAADEWGYNISASHCPICNRTVIRDQDMTEFLLQKFSLTRDAVKEEMRAGL